jgi:hypothetical protein
MLSDRAKKKKILIAGVVVVAGVSVAGFGTGFVYPRDRTEVGSIVATIAPLALGVQICLLDYARRKWGSRRTLIALLALLLLLPVQYVSFYDVGRTTKLAWTQHLVRRDPVTLRRIAVALETYYIDWSTYPPDLRRLTVKHVFEKPIFLKGGGSMTEWGPILESEYLHSSMGTGYRGRYDCAALSNWIVWFPGPDEDFDIQHGKSLDRFVQTYTNPWTAIAQLGVRVYDPTNGILSSGDIVRLGP